MSISGLTARKLGALAGVDHRTLEKMARGTGDFRLKKDQLYALIRFADDYGQRLFEVKAPEVWQTFENYDACIFRGPRGDDADVERQVKRLFEAIGCHSQSFTQHDAAHVRQLIRTQNCVFIGAPIANPLTDVALSEVYALDLEARPVTRKVPFRLIGRRAFGDRASLFVIDGSTHSIELPLHKRRINVDWFSADRPAKRLHTGPDAAVVVVRQFRNPDGRAVTTVIICGYRGLATLAAARSLTHEETPFPMADLDQGRPVLGVYTYTFKVRPSASKQGFSLEEMPRTGEWQPPWKKR